LKTRGMSFNPDCRLSKRTAAKRGDYIVAPGSRALSRYGSRHAHALNGDSEAAGDRFDTKCASIGQ
jgi:hypothetical protein